ncbi:hypothetical protein TNCV_2604041 [Trichonephila clavipes]|nr:hypothetical protein TNCV_2604041 [Trichonephila clavipes]
MTNRDPFSVASDIRSQLLPGAAGSMCIQTIRNRLHEVHLPERVPAPGVLLTTQNRTRHLAAGRLWYTLIAFDRGSLLYTSCVTCCSALVAGRTQHGIPARQCQAACRTLNSLKDLTSFLGRKNSPDVNPIEYLWDLIGRDMNL